MQDNLFLESTIDQIKNRIDSLDAECTPHWGIMNVGQMLAHCSEVLKNALGEIDQKRMLIGYLIAPFMRARYYDSEPYKKKNGASVYKTKGDKDFELEKKNLLALIDKFHNIEREKLRESTHPILGKFTPEQWAIGQYKHLDHHMRQFGV